MKLSIIIPCYNEDNTIKNLLNNLFEVDLSIEKEIIIVDDGSVRNQREFIEEEIRKKRVKFIRLHENQGKGVAIRIGLKYATGDIFLIQDADLEYFPSDIPILLEDILNDGANVIYGTRFKTKPHLMTNSHYLGNILLTKLTNFIYKTKLTDMETGYKLFTKRVLNTITLEAREFEFEPEITAKIVLNGFKIKELPINYHYRKAGYAKINWLDGIESMFILFQNRFCPNSKLYKFLYETYKFHLKIVINKLVKYFKKLYIR